MADSAKNENFIPQENSDKDTSSQQNLLNSQQPNITQAQPIQPLETSCDKPTTQPQQMAQPMVYGQPGQPMYGQPGQPMYGQPGQPMYGQPGQPMYGQPGQPMYGQPGQPMYGQPGQPMYGQPGQPMYGQPGQTMYGQPGQPGQPMYPPQPLGPPPEGSIYYHGQAIMIVKDPLEELAQTQVAMVVQEIELFEMMTGCETPNRYHVFLKEQNGAQKYLFKCKEESTWCQRNCCPPESHEFRMKVKHVISQGMFNDDFTKPYLEFYRPFKCTCCCLARPSMSGRYVESNVELGKVVEPYTCCDPLINVYNKDGIVRYKISTDCCQCGYCCRNSICGKLSEITFNIYNGNQSATGRGVGSIRRVVRGAINLFSDADTYEVTFPVDASPEEKLMLIGATLMLDYQYFESNSDDSTSNQMRINQPYGYRSGY